MEHDISHVIGPTPFVAWPREGAPTTFDYLAAIDRIMPASQMSPAAPYLHLGHVFRHAPLPRSVALGEARQCYRNAAMLAMDHPRLVYCEGYATAPKVGFPVHHAWCIDEQGEVLEVTWEPPADGEAAPEYVGLAFRTDFLISRLRNTGVWGLMGECMPSFFVTDSPETFLHPDWLPTQHQCELFRKRLAPVLVRLARTEDMLAEEGARKTG